MNVEEVTEALIEEKVKEMTREEAVEYFVAARVPIAPVYNVDDVVKDKHLIERAKNKALKWSKGTLDTPFVLPSYAEPDIHWWLKMSISDPRPIILPNVTHTIATDASLKGWGAAANLARTGGRWSPYEATQHINILELTAILMGLQALYNNVRQAHILVKCDNTTAVAFVNKMGGCPM